MAILPLPEGALLETRQDGNPCPRANGTTIGTDQKFVLLCGSDVVGDVLDRPDTDNFEACVDLCASHHPKCDAVSFNRRKCELRANLVPEKTHPSRRTDAAVGQFPGASSNCAGLDGSQVVQPNNMNFTTFCNFIINGKDLGQNFAATFQDCMGQCAGTTGCSAVSYDASMSQGFKNCYMKTGASASDNIADQGIDTAVVANNAAVEADPGPATEPEPAPVAPSPATTTIIQPTTVVPDPVTVSAAPPPASFSTPATAPAPAPAPATTAPPGVPSFFTPPGAGAPIPATTTALPLPASVETQTVISIITSVSVSDAVSVTQLITVPVTTEITATPPPSSPSSPSQIGTSAADAFISGAATTTTSPSKGSLDSSSSTPSSSRAWIAAPVVGSIAALVVVVLVFVMLGRRRMRGGNGRPSTSATASSGESGESGGGLFTTWLPGSPRFRNRIVGASGMGNFSSVSGSKTVVTTAGPPQARTGSVRSSVFGMLGGAGGAGGGGKGERLEDVEEGSDSFGKREKEKDKDKGDAVPVYEVRNGRTELRDSGLGGLNGLSQNRWGERKVTEYVYW